MAHTLLTPPPPLLPKIFGRRDTLGALRVLVSVWRKQYNKYLTSVTLNPHRTAFMNSGVHAGGLDSPQNSVLSDERCNYFPDIHTSCAAGYP